MEMAGWGERGNFMFSREKVFRFPGVFVSPCHENFSVLRYSGTENVCRVMVESSREDVVQRLARELSNVVRRVLG